MQIDRPQSNQPLPLHAKKVFQGRLFEVYQWEQEMYDGTKEIFEKIVRPDTITIIPVTVDKKILITKEEQPGIKPFISFPGGICETREDPLVAAQRELVEETGFVSEKWESLDVVQPYTRMDWAIFTFVAKECKKIGDPSLDAGEKIEVKEITFDDLLSLVLDESFRSKDLSLKILRLEKLGQLSSFKEKLFS